MLYMKFAGALTLQYVFAAHCRQTLVTTPWRSVDSRSLKPSTHRHSEALEAPADVTLLAGQTLETPV